MCSFSAVRMPPLNSVTRMLSSAIASTSLYFTSIAAGQKATVEVASRSSTWRRCEDGDLAAAAGRRQYIANFGFMTPLLDRCGFRGLRRCDRRRGTRPGRPAQRTQGPDPLDEAVDGLRQLRPLRRARPRQVDAVRLHAELRERALQQPYRRIACNSARGSAVAGWQPVISTPSARLPAPQHEVGSMRPEHIRRISRTFGAYFRRVVPATSAAR